MRGTHSADNVLQRANAVATIAPESDSVFEVESAAELAYAGNMDPGRYRTAKGLIQRRRSGAPVRCSRAYHAVDPIETGLKLEAAGFQNRALHYNRRGTMAVLEARYPGPETGGYLDCVKILMDHRGRMPLTIEPGALRVACLNQFGSEGIAIHHCSRDALDFVVDPAKWCFNAQYLAGRTRERLESLREVKTGIDLIEEGLRPWPKLQTKAREIWSWEYRCEGSPWAFLQAFTGVRSPRLQRLTALALGPGYADMLEGAIPACWASQ